MMNKCCQDSSSHRHDDMNCMQCRSALYEMDMFYRISCTILEKISMLNKFAQTINGVFCSFSLLVVSAESLRKYLIR